MMNGLNPVVSPHSLYKKQETKIQKTQKKSQDIHIQPYMQSKNHKKHCQAVVRTSIPSIPLT